MDGCRRRARAAACVDEPDGPAGEQDDRAVGQAAGQVAHGVRLARPRRAVQEQAALEMLAGAEQFLRPVGDADDVLFDGLKYAIGQDHILGRDRRPGQERDKLVAVMLALGEAEHLPAERVVGAHQPLDLGARRGGRRPFRREYLEAAQRRPELAFVPDPDHDRRAVRCRRRHQAKGDDLGVLLRADGDGTVASRPYPGVTSPAGNAGDPDSAPAHEPDAAEVVRRADQRQHVLVRPLPCSRRGEPFRVVMLGREVRVDPPLDVHMFPDREPLGHRHYGAQLAAEVAGDPERELRGAGVLRKRPDPDLEQQAEAARQPPEVLGVRRRKAGSTHPVNNARVR